MSGTAVKSWQQVVQQLEVLHAAAASGNAGLPVAAQLALLVHCNKQIAQGPSSSHATWEAIVHKEKLPQQLATAVSKLVPILGPDSPAFFNILDSLAMLLLKAIDEAADMPAARVSRLSTATAQQLQASGLLTNLPAVLQNIAQHVHASTAAAAKAPAAPPAEPAAMPTGGTPITPAVAAAEQQRPVHGTAVGFSRLCRLVRFVHILQGLWPPTQFYPKVSPATALASAEIAIAAIQDLSLWVQRVPAVYGSASRVDTNVLDSAVALMDSVLPLTDGLVWAFAKYYTGMDDQGKGLASANKAQLQSWAYQQCVVYLLLFAADALQICRTSADASGSGGSSSAAVPVMSDLEILQFSVERHAQLPRAHTRLLQLLGSDAPFGVFASVLLRSRERSTDVRKVQTWVVAYDTFMTFRQYLRLWPAQDAQQRQRETQLHELMPIALLSWVNGMQQDHAEYLSVVGNSMRVLAHEVREEWAEDIDPTAATRGKDLPGTAFFEHHLQQAATGPVKDITPIFLLGDFLSLLLKPLPWLVQQWQQQLLLPALPAKGSRVAKGKGVAGRSGSSSGSSSAQRREDLKSAIQNTLQVVMLLSANSVSAPSSALQLYGSGLYRAAVAVWAQHTPLLSSALDTFVRANTASDPNGFMSIAMASLLPNMYLPMQMLTVGVLLQAALSSAPGTPQQVQLFSLLCSLLKAADRLSTASQLPAQEVRVSVALAAAAMMHRLTAAAVAEQQDSTAASMHGVTRGPASAARLGAAGSSNRASTRALEGAAAAVLPWLVLLGRCCMQWSEQLQRHTSTTSRAGKQAAAVASLMMVRTFSLGSSSDVFLSPSFMLQGGPNTVWGVLETACRLCLQNSSMSDQLTAIGHDSEPLLDLLWAANSAVSTLRASGSAAGAVSFSPLAQALSALGLAMNNLPVQFACNNPLCRNLSGLTEAAMAAGKSRMCSGCRRAHYCGKDCQEAHWKQHRPVCKALAAMVTAAQP